MTLWVDGKVSWRGHAAVYSIREREEMAALPVNEQFVLHQLKARFGGEIQPAQIARSLEPEPTPARADTIISLSPTARVDGTSSLDQPTQAPGSDPRTYIDPEDIPFGNAPVRPQKRSYRLEWTNGTPTLHKTKKVAQRRMRAWVQWKRRQGFQVITHPTGYFAGKDSVREAVQIREVAKEKAPEGA